jgi:chemotaxis protein methyltransferase CheR
VTLDELDFHFVRQLVLEGAGNLLDLDKSYLVETRLQPLMEKSGVPTLPAFVDSLRRRRDAEQNREVVEAMLITETFFFRDSKSFDYLSDSILPSLAKGRDFKKPIRIWSAACSSGQEAYSAGILLMERYRELVDSRQVNLVASDLSRAVLVRAKQARYSEAEIARGLSVEQRRRWFHRHDTAWQLDEEIRRLVQFEVCNLKSQALIGPWDVVLLRNVLIYFPEELRRDIYRRIHAGIVPGGWLVLGATETGSPPPGEFFERVSGAPQACFRARSS